MVRVMVRKHYHIMAMDCTMVQVKVMVMVKATSVFYFPSLQGISRFIFSLL